MTPPLEPPPPRPGHGILPPAKPQDRPGPESGVAEGDGPAGEVEGCCAEGGSGDGDDRAGGEAGSDDDAASGEWDGVAAAGLAHPARSATATSKAGTRPGEQGRRRDIP